MKDNLRNVDDTDSDSSDSSSSSSSSSSSDEELKQTCEDNLGLLNFKAKCYPTCKKLMKINIA